jgi:capsular polysaccharide biosynthesis protein
VQTTVMEEPPISRVEEARLLRTPIRNLFNQNRFRDALRMVRRVRPDYPEDPWLATMQAYLHLVIAEPEQALEMAEEAARLGSEDPTVKLVIGAAHRNLGHHEEAAEALFVAQKLFPNRADVASMLLEEMTTVHGLDRARPLYAQISATIHDRELTTAWAKLLFRDGLDTELPPDWTPARVMSVPDWMARAGHAMEFVGVRETIPIEDPVVEGGPPPVFKAMMPGYVPYACTLRDATIFYRSNMVLMPDGVALNDTVADPEYGRFIAFTQDAAAVDQAGGRVLLDVGQFQVENLDAGIMLSGCASWHYGHWVGEYLSRLHYLERHPRFAELPIIVDADMPPQHLEYLRQLVPNRFVQIPAGGGLRCGELIVAGPTCFFPVDLTADHAVPPEKQGGFSVDCIRFLQDRVLGSMPAPSSRERKLYLSRKDRGGRRPLNEDQIIAYLEAAGFEIVFTENMSFADQVQTFREAKVIVAPNGSAVLNAIYAPDAPLLILSQRNLFNWNTFSGLTQQLGQDVRFVCAEDETEFKHSNYRIPIERLKAFLESSVG